MRNYTPAQLSLRNGQDREEVWVAVNGVIYDVTSSQKWMTGLHYDHWAGQELSEELKEAPHLPDVLKKFKVVGKLIES